MKQETFFRSLGVYIPELWAFRLKDSPACRELLEDVALLDTDNGRILAARGKRFDAPLPDACWQACPGPLLVSEKRGAFLLFPINASGSGQSLALFFSCPAGLVSAMLLALDRGDIAGLSRPVGEDPRLLALLSEILFYLDRLLLAPDALPLWTVVLRAANFAGCKLKRGAPSSLGLQLVKEEVPLFFSFLFCFFLSVRASGKTAAIDLEEPLPDYKVRFAALADDDQTTEIPNAPFLDCDTFRRFSLTRIDKGHRLRLSLRRPGKDVSSTARPRYIAVDLDVFG